MDTSADGQKLAGEKSDIRSENGEGHVSNCFRACPASSKVPRNSERAPSESTSLERNVTTSHVLQELNEFDRKTEKNSSELYFHYYAQLQHQQNMLQDYVRTGAYYSAIM